MNMLKIQTWTITPEGRQVKDDQLVAEEPLEIRLGYGSGQGRKKFPMAVTMRTPGDDEDLAVGFLFTEGILSGLSSVVAIRWLDEHIMLVELQPDVYVDEERLIRHFYTSSSCGVCGKASLDAVRTINVYFPELGKPKISPELLYSLPDKLISEQFTFNSTGGLHAAALFDTTGKLLLLKEDIGRHNAVDKVIGAAIRSGIPLPFRDKILLVSGRAGFELVQKAAMAGIPVMAAVGAPSGLSVALADSSNMTLIGFLRQKRFNIYSWPDRILES